MRDIKFSRDCYKDFINWEETSPDVFYKINDLIMDILRKVENETIFIAMCHGHYSN